MGLGIFGVGNTTTLEANGGTVEITSATKGSKVVGNVDVTALHAQRQENVTITGQFEAVVN